MLIINWQSFVFVLIREVNAGPRPDAVDWHLRMTFVSRPVAESPQRAQMSSNSHAVLRHTALYENHMWGLREIRGASEAFIQWFNPTEAEGSAHSRSALGGLLALQWKNDSHLPHKNTSSTVWNNLWFESRIRGEKQLAWPRITWNGWSISYLLVKTF